MNRRDTIKMALLATIAGCRPVGQGDASPGTSEQKDRESTVSSTSGTQHASVQSLTTTKGRNILMIVADEMRGRVMSIYMLAFRGGMPLGALLTGYLAERFALMHILRVQGIAVAALALVFLLSRSSVKEH